MIHIRPSNLAPSPFKYPKWFTEWGESMDRYDRYTWAVLLPGFGYTHQYALMMGDLVLNFDAMLGFLTWPIPAIVGAPIGESLFIVGLLWHIKTNSKPT